MFIFFTEVRNASEKLQLLCLSEEKSTDKRDFLQRFKSSHALDVTNARKQYIILTFFSRK